MQREMGLQDYMNMILRRKNILIISFVMVMVFVVVFTATRPPVFVSSSTFMLESKSLGFSDREGMTITEQVRPLGYYNAIMGSRSLRREIIRQITELGIYRWIPFPARRSVSRLDRKRLSSRIERWERIAKESLKQCGRNESPAITSADSFEAMLSLSDGFDLKIIFWENATEILSDASTSHVKPAKQIFMAIGPEGGFTEAEIEKTAACGFKVLSLGPRILKSDTATVAACVLVQYLYGDLGQKLLDKK